MTPQTVVFRIGDAVEVTSNEAGFVGSYYEATIVGQLTTGDVVYVVEYKNLVTDDFSAPLTESVPVAQIRPQPVQVQSTFFDMYQVVDAFDNDDLIGRVVSIHQPKDIQVKQNSQRLIDFVIEDCRESRLAVTLWDEHVDSVLPYFNGALTDPLIVIVQLCRARVTDDGEIRISSSYSATRVLFNYECPEVFAFKDRLENFGSLEKLEIFNPIGTSLHVRGCMPNEIGGLIGKTMKFMIVTREDQFKYKGNAAFTVLRVQSDEAKSNSFKKGEQGNVIRKLAEEKEFNENFGQVCTI
nr:replication protein A 70 kDa DNA-binding subunit B-like [Ipomoea batatas]